MDALIKMFFVILVIICFIKVLEKIIDRFNVKKTTVQAQSAQQVQEALFLMYEQSYLAYCDALIYCVANNCGSIDLCRPGDRPQHMPPDNLGVRKDNQGNIVFCYRFDRRPGLTSGGIRKVVYSTFPASQMMQKLNGTFPNYCVAVGLPKHKIIDAKDVGNGQVEFVLG